MGFAGYPALRLMALAETGTRGLLGAVLGSAGDRDEASLARRLLPLLKPGMLVLTDRAFDASAFLADVHATGALPLARARSARNPAVLRHLPDGSYLSRLDGLTVPIIEAGITITGSDGSRTGDSYRLITTLTSCQRYPALALVRLYHERWQIETACYALRSTLLNGRVLRSGDRPGAEQETWALLTLCRLLRRAMTDAIETRPGTDPDRASFTTALEAARDQLTAAAGIIPADPRQPGVIAPAILSTLLPARRPRYSARIVQCSTSRYHENDDSPPGCPPPSPRSTSRCTPRPWRQARPAGPGTPPAHPARTGHRPGGSASSRSWPASHRGTGAAGNSPSSWPSRPATCTPSPANGPSSASSPAPATAPTPSTRQPQHPRQSHPTLNFAALASPAAMAQAPLLTLIFHGKIRRQSGGRTGLDSAGISRGLDPNPDGGH